MLATPSAAQRRSKLANSLQVNVKPIEEMAHMLQIQAAYRGACFDRVSEIVVILELNNYMLSENELAVFLYRGGLSPCFVLGCIFRRIEAV